MKIKLTKKQTEVLKFLDDNQDESIAVSGKEAFYGNEQTNIKLIYNLLKLCCISADGYLGNDKTQYYIINGTGKDAHKQGFVELSDEFGLIIIK